MLILGLISAKIKITTTREPYKIHYPAKGFWLRLNMIIDLKILYSQQLRLFKYCLSPTLAVQMLSQSNFTKYQFPNKFGCFWELVRIKMQIAAHNVSSQKLHYKVTYN